MVFRHGNSAMKRANSLPIKLTPILIVKRLHVLPTDRLEDGARPKNRIKLNIISSI